MLSVCALMVMGENAESFCRDRYALTTHRVRSRIVVLADCERTLRPATS